MMSRSRVRRHRWGCGLGLGLLLWVGMPGLAATQEVAEQPAREAVATDAADDLLAALSPELRTLVVTLDRRLATIERFEAAFTRDRFTPLLRRPLRSTGRVWMHGPRVRWETREPRPGVTLLTGTEVWIYDPQEKRAEVYPIQPEYLPMGTSPMPRLTEMLANFSLQFATDEQCATLLAGLPDALEEIQAGALVTLWLAPREATLTEFLSGLALIFEPESQMLRRLVILQPGAERTVYSFEDFQINGSFPDRLLALDLPRGTTIERPYGGAEREGTRPPAGGAAR